METTRERLLIVLENVKIIYEGLFRRIEHPEEATDDPRDPLNDPYKTLEYLHKVLEIVQKKLEHMPGRERLN